MQVNKPVFQHPNKNINPKQVAAKKKNVSFGNVVDITTPDGDEFLNTIKKNLNDASRQVEYNHYITRDYSNKNGKGLQIATENDYRERQLLDALQKLLRERDLIKKEDIDRGHMSVATSEYRESANSSAAIPELILHKKVT